MKRWTLPNLETTAHSMSENSGCPGDNRIMRSISDYLSPSEGWNNLLPFWTITVPRFSAYDTRHRCGVCNTMIRKDELKFKVYQHREWKLRGSGLYIHGVGCFSRWVRETAAPQIQEYVQKLLCLAEDIQMQMGNKENL